jgi:hypothetical protein
MPEPTLKTLTVFLTVASLTGAAVGSTVLRDVHFKEDYNVNELPPSLDGKPLQVRSLIHIFREIII